MIAQLAGSVGAGGHGQTRTPPRLAKPVQQVMGDKGRVHADADHTFHPLIRRPFHPRQHPGQRSGETGETVGNHGQAITLELLGLAIGIDRQPVALRTQATDDMGQQGLAAQHTQRLVAATHAGR